MPLLSSSSDRTGLRRTLRAARRALSPSHQKIAARRLTQRLAALPELRTAKRIALYWPMDGEIDPRSLVSSRLRNRRFYLPLLRPFPAFTLRFAPWHQGKPMHRNAFGIPEPVGRPQRQARSLDAILMPLTGFDAGGNRLGMGGGFYDRTLSFRRHGGKKPLLIGLAHACQQVERLPAAPWDVPLNLVVTDRRVFRR